MLTAIGLDAMVLIAIAIFIWQQDAAIVLHAIAGIAVVFAFAKTFLHFNPPSQHRHTA